MRHAISAVCAAVCAATALAATAPGATAASVTFTFPSAGSTAISDNAECVSSAFATAFPCSSAGDTAQQTFAATGLAEATGSQWSFTMRNFTIDAGGPPVTNSFDVRINGITVDSFSFGSLAVDGGVIDISLDNSFAAIAGDSFTLGIVATSTTQGGGWNWQSGGTVTLTGPAPADPVGVIPLPASAVLLLGALGVLGAMRRRRRVA